MLNGISPVLIFTFKTNPATLSPLFNAISGIPLLGEQAGGIVAGVPIPLYLDERLSGLYVVDEAKNLDIETDPHPRFDDGRMLHYQRPLNSTITVNMLASRDSILLPVFLALADLVVPKLVSQNYSISYFNRSTVIFDGLLAGLNTVSGTDDDLIRISMQIAKTYQGPLAPQIQTLKPVTGPTPGLA